MDNLIASEYYIELGIVFHVTPTFIYSHFVIKIVILKFNILMIHINEKKENKGMA